MQISKLTDYGLVTKKRNKSIHLSNPLFTIPNPVVDFTGRERELSKHKSSFLHGVKVIGISGGGGIGKTELAYKLVSEIRNKYPDAQIQVNLLGTSDAPLSPEDAMRNLLGRFYQKLPASKEELTGLYQQTFATKKALILLDNAANAQQVKPLILRPPVATAFIITSRQYFSLSEVGLLEPLGLDVLSQEQSRNLFRKICKRMKESSDENIDQLSKLCGHLPLAIRVAASLLNARSDWTLDSLINRLVDERTRLERLKLDDDSDLDVNAILGLSYNALSIEMRKYFRALGVFPSNFKKHSLAAVCDLNDINEAEDLIGFFLTRSLIVDAQDPDSGVSSYRMHDLTSLFAQNCLLEYPQEAMRVVSNHADYFLGLANIFDKKYRETGNDTLTSSRKNFEYIWAHLSEAWKRLSNTRKSKWPRPVAADEWLARFASACPEMLLNHIAPSLYATILTESMDAARKINDKSLEISNSANLATISKIQGNYDKAIILYKDAMSIANASDDKKGVAEILGALATIHEQIGNISEATNCINDAITINQELNDMNGVAGNLMFLANIYFNSGDIERSKFTLELALEKAQGTNTKINEILILANLGMIYYSTKNIQSAIEYFERALKIARDINNHEHEAKALFELMRLYSEAERIMDAAVAFAKLRTILRHSNFLNANIIKSQVDGIRNYGDEFFRKMIRSSIMHDNDAPRLFELATKASVSSSIPNEVKEFYKVLVRLLAGVKNPDISNLQEPFAQIVKEELKHHEKSVCG